MGVQVQFAGYLDAREDGEKELVLERLEDELLRRSSLAFLAADQIFSILGHKPRASQSGSN